MKTSSQENSHLGSRFVATKILTTDKQLQDMGLDTSEVDRWADGVINVTFIEGLIRASSDVDEDYAGTSAVRCTRLYMRSGESFITNTKIEEWQTQLAEL